MFLILFGMWIILNGRWTAEIALTGLAVSALIYAFTCRAVGLSPRRELRWIRKAGKAAVFLFHLAGEVFRSSFRVLRFVWGGENRPVLTAFRTGIRSEFGRAILADSITLTPGTVTVHVQEDLFLVHCLDEKMAELPPKALEGRIREMETELPFTEEEGKNRGN